MKKLSNAEVAAPIFKEHPGTDRVYVVGQFGFISLNAAKLHAGNKRIREVQREGSSPQAIFTGDFDGMVKKELLEQATLRGMTLDSKMTNNAIIEALKAYDGTLGREIEEQDPTKVAAAAPEKDAETGEDPAEDEDPAEGTAPEDKEEDQPEKTEN